MTPTTGSAAARALRWTAALAAVATLALGGAVAARWDRAVRAPTPALRARTDSATVARGRYLAYGPAHCSTCHVSEAAVPRLARGEEPPLAGGRPVRLPAGTWYAANLTPDSATGIGRRTDGELARALRHNVRADGRALLPIMEYQRMADDDVVAVLSFLRAQPPVRNPVPGRDVNVVGRTVFALLGKSAVPPSTAPAAAPGGATAARGAYVANEVANCDACHTERDLVTGRYVGAPYGGGTVMPDDADRSREFVTPNLTPHPRAGHIARWTEAQFVGRMRAGRAHPGSPMHWEAFARMSDDDLRAVYRYLRTLPPAGRATGPTVRPRG